MFALSPSLDFSLDLSDSDLIEPVDDVDELDDFIDPAMHGEGESRLGRDTLVAVAHLGLHPGVALVHLTDQGNVLPAHSPHVEVLETRQEVSFLDLLLDLGPDFVHSWVVMPAHTCGYGRESVP
eukprot:CAMPEP_0170462430 /NCGR_PEP_ID=MMETSP0123-20130129/7937_1 /TAXON_ID=182087 /ORGANISM="Favella ehrenbergii, Strain Fehren 1" /LENGTH=123 /DNA_ID=CAMNT_0010727645 /DNA_START=452 /DNA_END=823 /DNA_ORIENTATION=+